MKQYGVTKRELMQLGMSAVLAVALAASGTGWAAEDPYLAGLHSEAQKLNSLGQAKKEQEMLEKTVAPVAKAPAEKPSAKLVEFETELEQYPAGYGLYSKLDTKDKHTVYQEYLKAAPNRRHAAAIRKTIELSVLTQR